MIEKFGICDIEVQADGTVFATLTYTDGHDETIVDEAVVVTHRENLLSPTITVKDVVRSLRDRARRDQFTLANLARVLYKRPAVLHFLIFGNLS